MCEPNFEDDYYDFEDDEDDEFFDDEFFDGKFDDPQEIRDAVRIDTAVNKIMAERQRAKDRMGMPERIPKGIQ